MSRRHHRSRQSWGEGLLSYLKSFFQKHPYRISRNERRRFQLFLWVILTIVLAVGVAALMSLFANL